MNIIQILKKNRPNLSEGSLKTYNSVIKNLLKKLNTYDIDIFYKEPAKVFNILENYEYSKRKTMTAAVIVLIQNQASESVLNKYKKLLLEDVNKYREFKETQEKTEKEKENWISMQEINNIYEDLEKEANILFKKNNLNMQEVQRLQNFIILSFYHLIPPRRLLDFSEMKIKDYKEDDDNYIKGDKLIFNKYKTKKNYGTQTVDMPKNLYNIYRKWLNFNDTNFLFFDRNNNKLSKVTLNQRLNKIFNKNISVNMLRHIYISEKVLKDTPALQDLKKTAEKMGHSVNEQVLYKKI